MQLPQEENVQPTCTLLMHLHLANGKEKRIAVGGDIQLLDVLMELKSIDTMDRLRILQEIKQAMFIESATLVITTGMNLTIPPTINENMDFFRMTRKTRPMK